MTPEQQPPLPPPEPERQPVDVIVSRTDRPGEPPPTTVDSTEVTVHQRDVNERARVDAYEAERVRSLRDGRARSRAYSVAKAIDAVWLIVGVLEVFLALRFVFQAAAARSAAEFVQFLYAVTDPFVWPFSGIFPVPQHGLFVFDPNVLIAMAMYALIGWVITRVLAFSIEPPVRP